MRGSGAFCDVPAVYMSFCREYWFWRFLAFACASGCFVAWRLVLRWYVSFMPLFARFVRGFVGLLLLSVILSLSGGRRFCVCCVRRFLRFVRLFLTAVCVFQHFCADRCFLSLVCFFCANFSLLLMSAFIFFSAVECCLLAICFFSTFPHYKSDFLSA